MRIVFSVAIAFSAIFFSMSAFGQNKISAADASRHYGETITICGTIPQDNFIIDTKTKNAFLILGTGSPNQQVTVVVPAAAAKKVINKPKNYYSNKNVCVTGKVVALNGKPEMVISDQDKIQFTGGGSEIKPNDFMRFE